MFKKINKAFNNAKTKSVLWENKLLKEENKN